MSWYPCCCPYDPPPCSNCTADSDSVTVDLSGIAVDACANCASFDGAYVLTRMGSNACSWRAARYISGCNGSPWFYGTWMILTLESRAMTPSANKGWQLTVQMSSGYFSSPGLGGISTAIYRWNSGSSADFDCTATRSLTLYLYTPDPSPSNNPCDTSSMTVTVNP